MNWWNVLVFGILPALSVVLLFLLKRKYLWSAPLLSMAISIIVSVIAMPAILEGGEATTMFFGISVPLHLVVAVALTGVAYVIAYLFRKKI